MGHCDQCSVGPILPYTHEAGLCHQRSILTRRLSSYRSYCTGRSTPRNSTQSCDFAFAHVVRGYALIVGSSLTPRFILYFTGRRRPSAAPSEGKGILETFKTIKGIFMTFSGANWKYRTLTLTYHNCINSLLLVSDELCTACLSTWLTRLAAWPVKLASLRPRLRASPLVLALRVSSCSHHSNVFTFPRGPLIESQ